ncbi:PREDICTED: uncharacterized protein LOC105313682 [Amphimedon queenslandica]|uniref:DUF4371 domain-containing protein n=1 Tax=Amphimedon queenslandica TaxID=400682 RepID=A0A1X7VRL2_AMPQE|nr:PREDICTED: uncharacterized protein LOC105313682 [Amphimedon queenslandica]|eukprot:XP_011405614.1 PREDICTED: uncharacterized protein LOC105313682 [Amphimedon queenslandica]
MAEFNGNVTEITSDTYCTSCGTSSQSPSIKRRKVYKQRYNRKWEKDCKLNDRRWLQPSSADPCKAYNKLCEKELVAGPSELQKHQDSKKHKERESAVTITRPITAMVVCDDISQKTKSAEIRMAAFLVEHNLPCQAMDHLSDLVTDIFSDSEIAKQFQSKHTKSRAIVKRVLADHFREELLHALAKTKFSIIIDETTDISSKKLLAPLTKKTG